jgi:hypothetical protein
MFEQYPIHFSGDYNICGTSEPLKIDSLEEAAEIVCKKFGDVASVDSISGILFYKMNRVTQEFNDKEPIAEFFFHEGKWRLRTSDRRIITRIDEDMFSHSTSHLEFP